jgi:hypothetical protein
VKRRPLVAILAMLALSVPIAAGEQRLSIRVSPVVAFAPALLTIRATMAPSADARRLAIEVDSASFSTKSEIPLEGKNSPRMKVIQLKNVPPGVYEVRAAVIGPTGTIANTMQVIRIHSVAGDTP